ncbi:hypothetical protein [Prescottella agglutinans]|uniref:DUF1203 domain-containing protein n=1 Tax=Prescottella agglutinans TaxID=1644129 RepID=A0ABT6M5E3_9NOCA|nr:hypothetical protein [Prescottella agglutinans]MDH6279536.1 hypothetical protein [Prescottella agglutinans]
MDIGIYKHASTLRDELAAQLAETRAGAPCFVTVHAGDIVPAYGCNCRAGEGVAWVRLVTMFPTVNYPEPYVITYPGAMPQLAVTLEMGVDRCYPLTDENEMPTIGQLDSAARDGIDDAAAMHRAALCAFSSGERVIPGIWEPRPVSGGIHGSTMLVTVLTDSTCGCDTEPPQIDEIVPPLVGDPRFPHLR